MKKLVFVLAPILICLCSCATPAVVSNLTVCGKACSKGNLRLFEDDSLKCECNLAEHNSH